MTTSTDTHAGGVEAVARIIAKWVDDERFADAPAFRMAAREIIAALAASPAAPAPGCRRTAVSEGRGVSDGAPSTSSPEGWLPIKSASPPEHTNVLVAHDGVV